MFVNIKWKRMEFYKIFNGKNGNKIFIIRKNHKIKNEKKQVSEK